MLKKFFSFFVLGSSLMLTACVSAGTATTGSTSANAATQTSASGSLLENLLGGLLGGTTQLSAERLAGTWNFVGTDCVFESENFLLKAGGEVAASQIETKLDGILGKVGFKPGACSYTFKADGTYTATIAGRQINGTFVVDAQNKTITMTYLAGLMQMTARVAYTGNSISLLYEGDKLLKLAETVAKVSGGTTGNTLSTLMQSYDGMLVGMKFKK